MVGLDGPRSDARRRLRSGRAARQQLLSDGRVDGTCPQQGGHGNRRGLRRLDVVRYARECECGPPVRVGHRFRDRGPRRITLLAATGDLGGDAAANCAGGPAMDYPASSPDVIAVGGTDPTLARNVLGQVTRARERVRLERQLRGILQSVCRAILARSRKRLGPDPGGRWSRDDRTYPRLRRTITSTTTGRVASLPGRASRRPYGAVSLPRWMPSTGRSSGS